MPGRRITLFTLIALSMCLLGSSGCFMTSIGMDRPEVRAQTDFGPPSTLRVCALLDDGISQSDAQTTLQDYWNETEASKYQLAVKLVSYSSLPRTLDEFFGYQIGRQVVMRQIPPGCDRMMYFVNRNVLDVAWSIPEAYGAPEVLGEVDDNTMTRGYVVDRIASLNQVLMSPWFTPSKVARHETFHMIGCGHDLVMDQCYKHIAEAKWIEERLRNAGCYEKTGTEEFFPAFSHEGEGPILLTRPQANSIIGFQTEPAFKSFVQCAQTAGLPVDNTGAMQVAWAQDWMDRAVQEAHRESAPRVIAAASSGDPTAISAAPVATPILVKAVPAHKDERSVQVPGPTASAAPLGARLTPAPLALADARAQAPALAALPDSESRTIVTR